MANRETPFQSELVKDMKIAGFHAFKASHQYSTGVLDIYCRTPNAALWIECKFIKPEANFRTAKVSLTVPQHAFAKREIDAGGKAVKLIGYLFQGQHGLFICDALRRDTHIKPDWFDSDAPWHMTKERGRSWDVETLLGRVWNMNQGVWSWAGGSGA